MLFQSGKQWMSLMGLILPALVLSACASFETRKSSPNAVFGGSERAASVKRAPLEIKSEEVLPYTAKLTYGEICVNSKRYGRQFCFPCYNTEGGGCDAAIEDLVDKAVACSSTIGPSTPRLPTFGNAFPTTPFVAQQPSYSPFTMPSATPNVYPNFSR